MSGIRFGTDGWRAIIAKDFTFDNCRKVAQAIASFVSNSGAKKKGLVIGYDNRFMSQQFARECAQVMVGNGIKVYFLNKTTPTPVTAFAITLVEAGGAVMITASHNPPEYNGLKFIPEYAGPAMPEVTNAIEAELERIVSGGKVYGLNLDEASQLGLYEEIDVDRDYLLHLSKIVDVEVFKKRNLKVIVDPMFGAGIGYLSNLLSEWGCEVKTINNFRDVLFGGLLPEPTESNLSDLKRAVVSYNAHIGLAMDGDADRFGIIDQGGSFVNANTFLYLLLDHLLKTRTGRGPVARTVATTHMIDRIARKNGLSVLETPVGFKYISQALREKGCIMGGEESGGFSMLGHIPEKDGILAGLLAVEMIAAQEKSLKEIKETLDQEYGKAVSKRFDIKVAKTAKAEIMSQIAAYSPKTVASAKVDTISREEGLKVLLEDGSWFLIRTSGTESLVRLYVEASDEENLELIKDQVINGMNIKY
ncbi:MAG: phosphoglucomutase/phosphomannomutase family protein [Syntrophomonadaceae bacterium]|jgi:alpha-D-glucose phosphate-specific phosphoglucomutase